MSPLTDKGHAATVEQILEVEDPVLRLVILKRNSVQVRAELAVFIRNGWVFATVLVLPPDEWDVLLQALQGRVFVVER